MPFRHALREKKTYALVVEDEIDQRMLLMLVLQREGLHVVGAANGLEATKLIIDPAMYEEGTLPGIIFLDWEMPTMNGQEFLAAVSMMNETVRRIPIVLTTGRKIPNLPTNVELLKKPYTLEQLMECVRRHMDVLDIPGATPSQPPMRVFKKREEEVED